MSKKSAKKQPSEPQPLPLRKHLDASTVAELEGYLRFWAPGEKRRNGRAALVERLRGLMSDENIVFERVDTLSERVRSVLLALLRRTHYTSDLQGLFRGMDSLDLEYYEGEAALTALVKRGLVHSSRAHNWLHYGRSAYSIPVEVALVLRGLAGVDQRTLAQVFTHEHFEPSFVEAGQADEPAPLPDSVREAIATLPEERHRRAATAVLEGYGGLITRHEFVETFKGNGIYWESVPFLQEFGSRGLGTVGHIDLRANAIGVDDDALLFFHETVERFFTEWRAEPPPHDRVLSAHGDLMSDVRTALARIREVPFKVSKEGQVYKSARGKLAERMQFPAQPLLERPAVADHVLAVVRGLGLAEPNAESQLRVTEKGEAWGERPLLDKVTESYSLVLADGTQTLRSYHLRRVLARMIELLTDERTREEWWPGPSLAMAARNRYLLELVEEEAPPRRAPLIILDAALTELGRAAHDLLLRDLFALGLVDVALHGDEPVGVRLSQLGERVLLQRDADPAARPLVVNPDFEILVLPEGEVDDLLHTLDRYAVRVRSGEVVHFRLDRAKIERAAVKGQDPGEIIAFLAAHARNELPQNVAYTIESWATSVRSGTIERGLLFRASDPTVLDAILGHPELKECVNEVLDERTLFFNEKATERDIARELRGLGVYLR